MNKKEFEKVINEEMSSVNSISANDVQGKYDEICELTKEINDTKDQLASLEMSLRHVIEEYNAALAMAIRKRLPKLSVKLSNGRCSASYRSTNLSCWPDLDSKMWKFEPNKYGRTFSRRYASVTPLSNHLEPLVDAIVNYFSKYRSLNA